MTEAKAVPLTISAAGSALRAGVLTASELTSHLLRAISIGQASLGAFVTVCGDEALEAAQLVDNELRAGRDRGPLMGIPLAFKDMIATREAATTANSQAMDRSWHSGRDAPVVARLRQAGAIIVGKTTTSEFAYGTPDPDRGFPVPRNPWNTTHSPGASSSGTGIAVAAGMALGGLGTDTGGSIRSPAAANGVTGLKVTFGRVPKNGIVPLSFSLDTVGPLARSARDCAFLLQTIAGNDDGDPVSSHAQVPDYHSHLSGDIEGIRVGLPIPYFLDSPALDDEQYESVLAAVDLLKEHGAHITRTALPHAKEAKEANQLIMVTEAFAYHRNNLAARWDDYGRYARRAFARGSFVSGGDYLCAQRFRSWFGREVGRLFKQIDVLITPAALGPAEPLADVDIEGHLEKAGFTQHWNLVGFPAAVLPCGAAARSGLPLAMQVVGKPFDEGTVLRVADAYQRLTNWHLRCPPVAAISEHGQEQ
jgi:aspartyl-tRNA(Asn)/glutamyl-tRNA(Gln) amidotransferase subunit A